MAARLLDALVFSSLWLAGAAAALCVASSLALGARPRASVAAVAALGTLVVYNADRLRDLARDRETAPERSAFVERHAGALRVLALLSATAATALALRLGAGAMGLLAGVLAVGLLHRRLKRLGMLKAIYLTLAWLAVVVGLPALEAARPRDLGWALAFLGTALFANAMASNVRDGEAAAAHFGPARVLRVARLLAAGGSALGVAAPAAVAPLAAVPLVTLGALLRFRGGERYGLLVVDGALLAGALVAIAWGLAR
jgi:hypothetical protein